MYVADLKSLFPQVQIQGKGLISTESFVSLPLANSLGSALSINSHFFEFKPTGSSNETVLAHELERGGTYEVVVSTSGGFYRYNLEDVVEVVGFREQCPLLKFLGRSNKVSDMFGEKLNEYHVADAIRHTLRDNRVEPSFYLLAPELEETPHYTLFIELSNREGDIPKGFGQTIDVKLQDNYHYKYCRRLGQLDTAKVFQISSSVGLSASDMYLEEQRKKGKKIGNIKPSILDQETKWSKIFSGSYID